MLPLKAAAQDHEEEQAMNTRHGSTCLLAAAFMILISLGCSIDSNEQSTSPSTTPLGLADTGMRDGSKLIGPAGGFVQTGRVIVEIPPGALLAETRVAIRQLADGSVDLLPDGQQFNVPVRLHIASPAGSAPTAYTIQWYDPARGLWIAIASSPESLGRVAPLAHFSIYRMISLID
jgi:hypothetical protein